MTAALVKRKALGLAPQVEAHFWAWLDTLQASLAVDQAGVNAALAFVRDSFHVTDNAGLEHAQQIVATARDKFNSLETDRKQFTSPLLAAKAMVDQVYKASTTPLNQTVEIVKSKILAFSTAQENLRRAAMAQSAAQYSAGGTPTEMIPEPAHVSGVSVRQKWVPVVVSATEVPRAYCSPDPLALAAHAARFNADQTPDPIPGVRFELAGSVTVRS